MVRDTRVVEGGGGPHQSSAERPDDSQPLDGRGGCVPAGAGWRADGDALGAYLSDSEHLLLDIAERFELPFAAVSATAAPLEAHGLLAEALGPQNG